LGSKEIQNLRLAANLLKQYSDIHTFAEFSGTIDKVVRLVNYKKLQHDGAPIDFIEFEKNPTTTGFDFIDQLIPLIQNKKVVKLRHQSFWSEEVTTFTVHPFYLKEYKGRWYLVGCTEERKGIRIFGLERIVSIEALALKRFTPRPFNPELYFEKFIGINVPDSPPEKIVLRFKNNVGKYIQTQPIHSSQQLIHTNTGIHEFSFYLCINWEFIGFVLGWQGNVEVMEPESFRKKIKKILEASLEQYS
jgi:predicted DNA-binding transcriptional regulator YafY